MNELQKVIVAGAREQSGLWDVITDAASARGVDRVEALKLLQGEITFIEAQSGIFLLRSESLYDSRTSEVLDKRNLLSMNLADIEFNKEGPFYYLSNRPSI